MWFYVMPYTSIPQPVEEEGIMVSFGDNENAGGMGSSSEPLAAPEEEILAPIVEQKVTTTKPVSVAKEELITSNDNANAIAEKTQKDKDRKLKEQDLKQKQLLDNQRIATENRIAQQKQKEQDAKNNAAVVNGLFSNGSTNSGSGNGKGSGNGTGNGSGDGSESGIQGNPAGHGNLGGNSWNLNGRSLTGRLISPSYDNDVEGKITVSIRVDENGHVVSASVVPPSTISDSQTRNAALSAAKNTKFTAGKGIVAGTIVYNFKLK